MKRNLHSWIMVLKYLWLQNFDLEVCIIGILVHWNLTSKSLTTFHATKHRCCTFCTCPGSRSRYVTIVLYNTPRANMFMTSTNWWCGVVDGKIGWLSTAMHIYAMLLLGMWAKPIYAMYIGQSICMYDMYSFIDFRVWFVNGIFPFSVGEFEMLFYACCYRYVEMLKVWCRIIVI